MKINTIVHTSYVKRRSNDVPRVSIAKGRKYHPFMAEREYIRALNAVKIERLLAKPFVLALDGHGEGILQIDKCCGDGIYGTASFDGQVNIWNIAERIKLREFNFGNGLKGISMIDSNRFVVANAGSARLFHMQSGDVHDIYSDAVTINRMSCYHDDVTLLSTSHGLKIVDVPRASLIGSYGDRSVDSACESTTIRGVCCYSSSKSLVFVDNRSSYEFLRLKLPNKSNELQFNKEKGYIIGSANEDSNVYLYDIRYVERPLMVFKHHVNSVTCMDFSGMRLATGSFDKTVRIFDLNKRECIDVYYNRRMQNVNGVKFSNCSKFIVSASDDGSLRVWKSESSRKIGYLNKTEENALKYSAALKEKFRNFPEIKRIRKHRFLPKKLKNEIRQEIEHEKAVKRKRRTDEGARRR